MTTNKQEFSSHADPALLDAIRKLAKESNRPFQSVLEDAMRVYLELQTNVPREEVMEHLHDSIKKNYTLGKLLAQ